MAGEIEVRVTGNLTADPELRYTQGGTPVVNFTVASTPRRFDRERNEWVDGAATFLRCTAWRAFAENVANTLRKGTAVVLVGSLAQREYQDREGNKRVTYEVEVQHIGPSLQFATAEVRRVSARGPAVDAPAAADDALVPPHGELPPFTPPAEWNEVTDTAPPAAVG